MRCFMPLIRCKQLINKHLISPNSNHFIKMSSSHGQPKRYFINSMPDYHPELSESDDFNYKSKIEEIADFIWQKTSKKSGRSDPYVGNSGIAYMFWYLSQQEWLFDEQQRITYLDKSKYYIKDVLKGLGSDDRLLINV